MVEFKHILGPIHTGAAFITWEGTPGRGRVKTGRPANICTSLTNSVVFRLCHTCDKHQPKANLACRRIAFLLVKKQPTCSNQSEKINILDSCQFFFSTNQECSPALHVSVWGPIAEFEYVQLVLAIKVITLFLVL